MSGLFVGGGGSVSNSAVALAVLGSNNLTGDTVTASSPLIDMAETWNNAGVTFTGLRFNATDTASAFGSLLLDLQVGGVSQFSVRKDGGMFCSGVIVGQTQVAATYISLSSGVYVNYDNAGGYDLGSAQDVKIRRDAANTLALRNGGNAQTFNVYRTYTDGANYERIYFGIDPSTSTAMGIGTVVAGGTARDLYLRGGSTTALIIGASSALFTFYGNHWFGLDNTYDIGASGANRPRRYFSGLGGAGSSGIYFGDATLGFYSPDTSQIYARVNSSAILEFRIGGLGLDTTSMITWGGVGSARSASFPALKRSATTLQARLADDSAFAPIQGKITTDNAYTAGAPPAATGYVTIYDFTGTAYRVAVVV